MYIRDARFRDLLIEDAGHRGELHKTIIDMPHGSMRTNEKVLNLLYEEVIQGAHKAEITDSLCDLTSALRRVGELPPSFTHKFEKFPCALLLNPLQNKLSHAGKNPNAQGAVLSPALRLYRLVTFVYPRLLFFLSVNKIVAK